jgi:uncharacterized protein
MGHRFLELLATASVKQVQVENGSRDAYARMEGGAPVNHRLEGRETVFLAQRDSFYMASVSASGWPYLQHRGGPAGFIKVLDHETIGMADYRGNRQYISLGNVRDDNRVALFAMDYPNRRRLKILGRLSVVDLAADPDFARRVIDTDYGAKVERGLRLTVEAFDWNCPQHITPRFTERELEGALSPIRDRLAELEAENRRLRERLGLDREDPAA